MLTEDLKTASRHSFNKEQYEAHVERISAHTLENFRHIAKQYALFHIGFFALGFLELLGLMLFFAFLTQSAIFAFTLASIFFTGFTYFVLLFYPAGKKAPAVRGSNKKPIYRRVLRAIAKRKPRAFCQDPLFVPAFFLAPAPRIHFLSDLT